MPRIDPWATPITTLQNAATANGNGTEMSITGLSSMAVQITGTFSATINFEVTVDGVNWIAILGQNVNTGSQSTSAMAPGIYTFALNGLSKFRARISNYVSGSITVVGVGSALPLAALSSAIINATVDAVKIKDATGTNTLAIDASGNASVTLNGRNVQPTSNLLTNTPLVAGGYYQSPWRDLTVAPGVFLVALEIRADTLVMVQYKIDDGSGNAWIDLQVVLPPGGSRYVRPYRPIGKRGCWVISNPTTSNQTVFQATEYVYTQAAPVVQNQQSILVYKLAVRDTITHTLATDPHSIFQFIRSGHGGGKVPIYVNNGLNQAATITVLLGPIDTISGITLQNPLGTKNVPASSRVLITNMDFPGLDVPSEVVSVYVSCTTAPTSGDISVMVDNSTGGGV